MSEFGSIFGKIPNSGQDLDLVVSGGTVAVVRIAVAAPADVQALGAARFSEIPIRLDGNKGLESAGDLTIQSLTRANPRTYLIVRATNTDIWSLDGRGTDGTYAGYGQLYRTDAVSTLRSALETRTALGATLSLLFAVALLLAAMSPWLRRRLR